jgi:hypothetical protein
VDAIAGHAPTAEPGREVLKEGGRAAQRKVGFAGYAQLFEGRDGQPAGSVEVNAQPVSRLGAAIPDVVPGLGQLKGRLTTTSRIGELPGFSRRDKPAGSPGLVVKRALSQ